MKLDPMQASIGRVVDRISKEFGVNSSNLSSEKDETKRAYSWFGK